MQKVLLVLLISVFFNGEQTAGFGEATKTLKMIMTRGHAASDGATQLVCGKAEVMHTATPSSIHSCDAAQLLVQLFREDREA